MQNLSKYTSWILYGIMLITVICFALFYFGGIVDPTAEYPEPKNTGLVLNLAYVILGIGAIFAVLFALFQFGMQLKDHPKEALTNLAVIGAFALLLIISWVIGDGTPLNLPAYDGEDNVYFWLKLTDMWLYSAGFLMGASILSIIVFSLVKVIRK